jgi:2-octaprenyl-6-methoxyphenol hydroxylase
MTQLNTTCDVIIVGGGMVGLATALRLARGGVRVVMLEASVPNEAMHHSSFDSRTLVVNPASRQFWQDLGIWQRLSQSATAIEQVHVSNKGRFGTVLFDKTDFDVDALGHVVEAQVLGSMLWQEVKQTSGVQLVAPAQVTAFEVSTDQVQVTYKQQDRISSMNASLLIAADGAQSSIRTQLGLPTHTKAYEKTAIICNLKTERPHRGRAYERLTASGPFALLPFHERLGLVWSNSHQRAEQLLAMDESAFMAQAQAEFGQRLGRFTQIGTRHSYPLFQIRVEQQFADRVVLMGNAAHAVSPVSAQGLNLAVRGVRRLTDALLKAGEAGMDLGVQNVLAGYQAASMPDQNQVLNYTDDLMTWFKIDEPVIAGIRSLGMLAIDASPAMKRRLYELAGGLNH